MLVAVAGVGCKSLWHCQRAEDKKKLVLYLILHSSLKWHESASPCHRPTKAEKGKKEEFGVAWWFLRLQGCLGQHEIPL